MRNEVFYGYDPTAPLLLLLFFLRERMNILHLFNRFVGCYSGIACRKITSVPLSLLVIKTFFSWYC